MDFHAIQDVCHGDDANGKVLQFMQRHHLVSSHEDCVCGTPMNIQIFLWRRRLHMEVSKNGLQGNKVKTTSCTNLISKYSGMARTL